MHPRSKFSLRGYQLRHLGLSRRNGFGQAAVLVILDMNEDNIGDANESEDDPQVRILVIQVAVAIALMLLDKLNQANPGGQLYVESLTNLLAVHLLRQYATAAPKPFIYPGGLPQRQLVAVLDYIHDRLDGELKLADLAAIARLNPFHFSHQFKQAMGVTPYQYVLQQRIERAKQLLKQTNRPIVDIALRCGFNSHSHLSKQFRQATGTTPSTYRATSPYSSESPCTP